MPPRNWTSFLEDIKAKIRQTFSPPKQANALEFNPIVTKDGSTLTKDTLMSNTNYVPSTGANTGGGGAWGDETTTTTGKTTLNNNPPDTAPGDTETEEQRYAKRVQGLQSSLKTLLDNIEQQKGFARESRDTVQGHLGNTYWGGADQVYADRPTGGLIGSNLNKRDSELGLLDENLGTVNDLYLGNAEKGTKGYLALNEDNRGRTLDTLDKTASGAAAEADRVIGTNARNAQESNTLNRVLARARGMLGSSIYGDMQNKNKYQAEEIGQKALAAKQDKIDETGFEKGRQNNWYDTKQGELNAEHENKVTTIKGEKVTTAQFHNELDRQYRGDYKTAWEEENTNYESKFQNLLTQGQMFGIDNADQLDNLYADHQTRLNAIADYASKQGATGTNARINTINDSVATKKKTFDDRSAEKNIASALNENKAVNTMNDAKATQPYVDIINDNTANQNALNSKYIGMQNMGLPQEANASAKINIKKPTAMLDEKDPYGYYLNNLLAGLQGRA